MHAGGRGGGRASEAPVEGGRVAGAPGCPCRTSPTPAIASRPPRGRRWRRPRGGPRRRGPAEGLRPAALVFVGLHVREHRRPQRTPRRSRRVGRGGAHGDEGASLPEARLPLHRRETGSSTPGRAAAPRAGACPEPGLSRLRRDDGREPPAARELLERHRVAAPGTAGATGCRGPTAHPEGLVRLEALHEVPGPRRAGAPRAGAQRGGVTQSDVVPATPGPSVSTATRSGSARLLESGLPSGGAFSSHASAGSKLRARGEGVSGHRRHRHGPRDGIREEEQARHQRRLAGSERTRGRRPLRRAPREPRVLLIGISALGVRARLRTLALVVGALAHGSRLLAPTRVRSSPRAPARRGARAQLQAGRPESADTRATASAGSSL